MKNPYFRLIGKAFIFVIIFILIDKIIGIGFTDLRNKVYSKNEFSQKTYYCIERCNSDIVVIGSSTASHQYIPIKMEKRLGMSVYNFAKDGCFFLYQNTLINLMLDRYAPKVIIWEIGESCLSDSHDSYEYQGLSDFYPWYSNPYVQEVVDSEDCFKKIRMKSSCYRENSKLIQLLRTYQASYCDPNKGYIPSKKTEFVNTGEDEGDYYIEQNKVNRLNQTIKRCKDNGVEVIITSGPRYYSGAVLQTDYYHKLLDIAEQNDIPVVSFYKAEPFCSDSTLFKDNAHLNYVGAELYMDMFIPVLDSILQSKKIKKSKNERH